MTYNLQEGIPKYTYVLFFSFYSSLDTTVGRLNHTDLDASQVHGRCFQFWSDCEDSPRDERGKTRNSCSSHQRLEEENIMGSVFFLHEKFIFLRLLAKSTNCSAIEISDQNTLVVASCTPSPHNLPILTHLSNFNRKICIAVVESANEPRDGTVKSVAPFSFTLLFSSTFANGSILEPPPIYQRPRTFIVHNSSL